MKEKESKEAFFDWAYDTRHIRSRDNKIAWAITGVMTLITISAVLGVAALTPLKENVPLVFTVDKNTGIVEPRTTLNELGWNSSEAQDFSNVYTHINLREGYLRPTYPTNYEKAVRQSTGIARTDLVTNFAPDAPRTPILKYRDKTQVDLRFKSVNYHGEKQNVVIARYIADIKTGEEIVSKHYIATVQFEYAENQDLSLMSRLSNPFAFVVSNYQNREEGFQ